MRKISLKSMVLTSITTLMITVMSMTAIQVAAYAASPSVTVFSSQRNVDSGKSNVLTREAFIKEYSNSRGNTYYIEYNGKRYTPADFFDNFSGQSFLTGALKLEGTMANGVYVRYMTLANVTTVKDSSSQPAVSSAPNTSQPTVTIMPETENTVFFDEVTLLSNEELEALAEVAPSILDTRSATTMTRTKMTDAEIASWTAEYFELGGINQFELEVIRLINEERAKYSLQPLAIMPHYMQAARLKSQEMCDLSYLTHESPVYGSRGAFISLFGRNMGASETLAGKTTPEDTVNAWLTSAKGHREILLSDTVGAIGVGVVGNGFSSRATAMLISKDAQYIGQITVSEYLNGARP